MGRASAEKKLTGLVRNSQELELMKKSGQITALALKKVITEAKEGMSLAELDQIAESQMIKHGAQASFKTVPGYHWATCLTVNDEVVHGIPRQIKIKDGDVLGIDLGAVYHGWHTDAAWSIIVGGKEKGDAQKIKFLDVGQKALSLALESAVEGQRIGDISWAIQSTIEGAGYHVVKSLAGHGVGRAAHEEPEIPEYGKAGRGLVLKKGMTLAIEAIYTAGSGVVCEKDDGWTLASCDGSLGGLFEMSVIVGENKAEVLTDWRVV